MATITKGGLPREVTNHPAYPGHKLNRVTDDKTFECDGCMRSVAGTGTRYSLEGESLVHHICCAVEPVTQPNLTHPRFGDLEFLPVPPERTDGKGRFCGACGEGVIGFVYHCSGTGISFHPCCAIESCKCSVAAAKTRGLPSWSRYRNTVW